MILLLYTRKSYIHSEMITKNVAYNLVEARRIELLSKNSLPLLSTGVAYLWHSPARQPTSRLRREVSFDAWRITRLLIRSRSPLIDAHMRPRYSAIGRAAFNYAASATVLLSVNFKVFSFEVNLRSLPAYNDLPSLSKPLRPHIFIILYESIILYPSFFKMSMHFS